MDIVERLRKLVIMDEVGSDNSLGREAADEIERLRKKVREHFEHTLVLAEERDLLQEALQKIEYDLWNMANAVDDADWYGTVEIFGEVVAHKKQYHQLHVDRLVDMAKFAGSALQQKESE